MILTVTFNPAVDHTVSIDGTLEPEVVNRSTDAQFDAGGKGINVSKYLVALDRETLATGVVGGFLGRFVSDQLRSADIPHDFVNIDGLTRLNTTVLADEQYKINHRGPTLDDGDVESVVETIREYDPSVVVVAGSLPPGIGTEAVDRIASAGPWDTAVDLGGTDLWSLEESYALAKPNREELAEATDQPVETVEDCIAAANRLRDRGFDRVVASLGSDGAIMVSDEGDIYAPALDVSVVDTVGAGDSLLAGVIASLAAGESDQAALKAGVAVSARVVAVPGTKVPALADVSADAEDVAVSGY